MTRSNTDWAISDIIAIIALETEEEEKRTKALKYYRARLYMSLFCVVVVFVY